MIAQFFQVGSVGISVNDDIKHYFQPIKGPMLFNIMADMLAILIVRREGGGQVGGLVPHL